MELILIQKLRSYSLPAAPLEQQSDNQSSRDGYCCPDIRDKRVFDPDIFFIVAYISLNR